MAIRIKNEHIHAMAKELAALTGQTQVAAVTQALEEMLARIQAVREELTGDRTVSAKATRKPIGHAK